VAALSAKERATSAKEKATLAKDKAKRVAGDRTQRSIQLLKAFQSRAKKRSRRRDDPEAAKVEQLCTLGFSPPTAKHALARTDGKVEVAGSWLLDDANSDEIYAVEVQALNDAVVEPLCAGCVARIGGLRNNVAFNGSTVLLREWNADRHRWLVQLPSGELKFIRAENLDSLAAGRSCCRGIPNSNSSRHAGELARKWCCARGWQ